MDKLLDILKSIGFPYAYDHFAEGEAPDPPFLCYLLPGSDNFSADGYAYYTISNNMGYEGDLELAMVPESFRTDVLKESLDDNSVLVESANVETANFALLFEFDGDVKKIRHVLYNCSAARPNIESTTNEEEIEVQTETLAITAAPLANGYVKARTGDSTTDTVYTGWYTAVYLPEVTPDTSGTQQSGQQGTDDETGGETL